MEQVRNAKKSRLWRHDLAGIQIASWIDSVEEHPNHCNSGIGYVLAHPSRVFVTDTVVMRKSSSVIHERLLDRTFYDVVLRDCITNSGGGLIGGLESDVLNRGRGANPFILKGTNSADGRA